VGRVLDGTAYALLADGVAGAVAGVTFEAEAEKPTRAPGKKKAAAEPATGKVADELQAEEPEAVVDEPDADAAAAGEQPKKKRTRRGTRGGRARKKKPATVDAAAAGASVEEAAEDVAGEADAARPLPTIHVPPPDLGGEPEEDLGEAVAAETEPEPTPEADGVPKKKRTRRGSRGGRRRRKPAASNGAPEAGDGSQELEPAQAAETEADTGYVPMSEWIDDVEPRASASG
jgi:hypothetical protein